MISGWVRAGAASSIDPNVTSNPKLRGFLCDIVRSGSTIPELRGLASYLKDCVLADREKLKQLCRKKVEVFYDITFDEQTRFVCAIMIAVIPPDIPVSLKPIL